MKVKLNLSSVHCAKELHQTLMQRALTIFGFVVGVEIECDFQSLKR